MEKTILESELSNKYEKEKCEQIESELQLLKMLDEAEEDVKNEKNSSIDDMFDEIRKKIKL